MNIGRKRWALAEGYIPEAGPHADSPVLRSHETACILNAGDNDAHLRILVYFSDREPAGPYAVTVAARRTLHLRFENLSEPEALPRGVDFSTVFESDQPVVIQHTRLDSRLGQIALLSTIAYAEAG